MSTENAATPATPTDVLVDFLSLGEDVEFCPVCRGDFISEKGWCRDCGYDENLTPLLEEVPHGHE